MMAGYFHLAEKLRIASRVDANREEIARHRDWCDLRHDLMTGFHNPPRPCDCEETGEKGKNAHLSPHVQEVARRDGQDPRITST